MSPDGLVGDRETNRMEYFLIYIYICQEGVPCCMYVCVCLYVCVYVCCPIVVLICVRTKLPLLPMLARCCHIHGCFHCPHKLLYRFALKGFELTTHVNCKGLPTAYERPARRSAGAQTPRSSRLPRWRPRFKTEKQKKMPSAIHAELYCTRHRSQIERTHRAPEPYVASWTPCRERYF